MPLLNIKSLRSNRFGKKAILEGCTQPTEAINDQQLNSQIIGQVSSNQTLRKMDLSEISNSRFSRRKAIGLAGFALASYPVFKRFSAVLVSDFNITKSKNRIALLINGTERFVVDAKKFGGTPTVLYEKISNEIHFGLKNAYYPGTMIKADFMAVLKPGVWGRSIEIKMDFGRFSAKGNLEDWLLGYSALQGSVRLKSQICELKKGEVGMFSSGYALAKFYNDWQLEIEGENIAMVAGLGANVLSNNLSVSLLDKNSGSLVNTPTSRRTLLSIKKDNNFWGIVPCVTNDNSKWNFQHAGDIFNVIEIECGVSKNGNFFSALVAHSQNEFTNTDILKSKSERHLQVIPHQSFQAGLAPFGIALQKPRYAIMFDRIAEKRTLVAEYAKQHTWFHADNMSVFLGDHSDDDEKDAKETTTPDIKRATEDSEGYNKKGLGLDSVPKNNFEISSTNGILDSVYCAPALKGTFIPIADDTVINEPRLTEKQERIIFADGYTTKWKKLRKHENVIVINDNFFDNNTSDDELRQDGKNSKYASSVYSKLNPTITLIRPEDLVALDFEFVNFTVENGVAKRGSGKAYMVVHFQPQNIAEEAFWEAETQQQSENPSNPPVRSRIAGPSRVAFRVPSTQPIIQLNLEELLKLCSVLEMNTADTAKPSQDFSFIATLVTGGLLTSSFLKTEKDNTANNPEHKTQIGTKDIGTKSIGKLNEDANKGVRNKMFQFRSELIQSPQDVQSSGLGSSKFPGGNSFKSKSGLSYDDKLTKNIGNLDVDEWGDSQENPMPIPHKPENIETAIEAPYRLIISPSRQSGWAHASIPIASQTGGKIELWHSRLGRRLEDSKTKAHYVSEEYDEIIRAIWSPDYDASINKNHYNSNNKAGTPGTPFRMSLDDLDRCNIVALTSNFRLAKQAQLSEPAAVNVKSLMLSSLGAWLDVRGDWNLDKYANAQPNLTVEQWQHRATMGRDHYVKIVEAGYLFPLGHRASLVKVTERKFHNDKPGNVAYLRQRMFIIVREKVRTYYASTTRTHEEGGSVRADLEMPIKRVEITTSVTPKIDKPEDHDINNFAQSGFWPYVAGKPFLFSIVAEDMAGTSFELNMPLVFTLKNIDADQNKLNEIVKAYNADTTANKALTELKVGGKTLMYAQSTKTGDTSFETQMIRFVGYPVSRRDNYSHFHPTILRAGIVIPSMKGIANNTTPVVVAFEKIYAQDGFGGQNKGEVFLKLLSTNTLSFNELGDRAGGFAKPNVNVKGLSRIMGPVGSKDGNLSQIANGNFDPKSHFGDLMSSFSPKLFGVFDLWDILASVGLDVREAVPKLLSSMTENVEGNVNNFKVLLELAQFVIDLVANDSQGKDESSAGLEPKGYKTFADGLKKAFDQAANKFNDTANGLVTQLKSQIQAVLNKQINSLVETAKQQLENSISSLASNIQNQIKSKTDPIEAKINDIRQTVTSLVTDIQAISNTSNFQSLDLSPLTGHLTNLRDDIRGLIGAINTISEIPSSARNAVISPLSTVENIVADIESLAKFASDVINTFKIKPQLDKVISDVSTVYTDVLSLINEIKTKSQQESAGINDFLNISLTPLKNHLTTLRTDLNGLCNKVEAIFIIPAEVRQLITKPISNIEVLIGGATTVIDTIDQVIENLRGAIKAYGCVKAIFNDVKKIVEEFGNIFSSGNPLGYSFDPLEAALNQLSEHITELGDDIKLITLIPSPQRNAISSALSEIANIVDKAEDVVEWLDKIRDFIDGLRNGGELRVSLEWKPVLKDFPSDKPIFVANNKGKKATFAIGVYVKAKLTGGAMPEINGAASLQNFTIAILPQLTTLIKLHFNKLEFKMGTSGKPDIVCEFDEIEFVGPLSFVETLKKLIPLDGFSDPPFLDVSLEGIKAGFTIALPNVAVGIFSLTNMALGAFLNVPFIGPPLTFGFNFCTRENPFCMTVWIIGGGGFFGITLNPRGMQKLEMALEAGAKVGLDFGVASGSVEIMLGIYFSLERITQKIGEKDEEVTKTTLEGYLRICGRLSVLGLIKATITLKLSLTYEFESGKLVGRATIEIEVEVLFFSTTVSLSYERKFAGSNGDPSFRELMSPYSYTDSSNGSSVDVKPWEEYCMAFA